MTLALHRVLTALAVSLLFGGSLIAQSQLALTSGTAPSGSPVVLNLAISSPAGSEPAALQWTFSYPAASVTGLTVNAGPALVAAAKTLNCAGSANAYVCVASGINSNVIANGAVASVSITLASSATSAAIGVSGAIGASLDGNAISVTATGGTASQTITTSSTLSGLSCNPSSLAPSATAVCTVTLSSSSATSTAIGLTAGGSVTVPSSVSVAANATSATFNATAGAFTADQSASVTATLNGISKTASLSLVTAPAISSLQCTSTSLAALASTTCTVTLSKAAPTGGSAVTLSSSNTGALTVPASVTVAAAATTATFTATAAAVTTNQSPVVTATLNGSKTATFTVTAPLTLTSLQCGTTTLAAAASTTCTVTLSKSAPAGGALLTVSSNPTGILITAPSVTVAAGSATATFTAIAASITTDQSTVITVTLGGSSRTVNISVFGTALVPTSLTCPVSTITPNKTITCTVRMNHVVPAGPASVALSISYPTNYPAVLTVPASVTIPVGASAVDFAVTSGAIGTGANATIRAQSGQTAVSFAVALSPSPYSLSTLSCSPTSVTAGLSGNCSVTLTAAAPTPSTVALSSTNSGLTVPASLTIPAGSISATFTFNTTRTLTAWAIVSASLGTVTKSQGITISAARPGTSQSIQLHCNQPHIAAGASAVCDATFNGDAFPQDGIEITISTSSPQLRVPASIRGRAGAHTIRFEVQSDEDSKLESVDLEAHSGSAAGFASLMIVPSGPVHLRLPRRISVTPGTPVRFTASGIDDQGLPAAVTARNKPAAATFDETSGQFEWTPEDGDLGPAEIAFTATSSLGLSATKTVAIEVVSSRPVLSELRNAAGSGAVAACSPGALATVLGTALTGLHSRDGVRLFVNGDEASIVRAGATQIDFLCPSLAPETPLRISAAIGEQRSNELQTVMQQASPGLFSVDGSGSGQGAVMHARGIASLPRFGLAGMPAAAGDEIVVLATGIPCDLSAGPKPVLYFGQVYGQTTDLRPAATPGVCEVHSIVPGTVSGNAVPLLLELIRGDGAVIKSNAVLVAVE